VREVRSLCRRVHLLEERIEEQQETIVEGVQRNWMRDAEYERLLREQNRLKARLETLEASASVVRMAENRARDEARERIQRVCFEGADDNDVVVID